MDWHTLSNYFTAISVISAMAILAGNIYLYIKIKSKAFLLYVIAWIYTLCVSLYAMVLTLFPKLVRSDERDSIFMALMAIAFVIIAIGTFCKIKAIFDVFRNGKEK